MKIALMNGANEIELPWYARAEYSNDLGHWSVDKYVFTTKLEVVFPAAPEAEFLDYRESSNVQQPINGWALWPDAPCGPIFYGQLADSLPIYIDRAMSVSFYVALDMHLMSHSARNAALHVLFDEPQRAGHLKGLASLLEATNKEMRRAPAYNMMDNAAAYRVLQGTKSTAS
jgi:hypothetical protein